jgi:catechol 2,3-dioxygenase-like lactoylglutathione lyase family enzyme
MKRVIGIGGVFFKSKDPASLIAWYEKHLGMRPAWEGGVVFEWRNGERPDRVGQTIWSPFKADTDYFQPSGEPFMINYVVEDLEALTATLTREGIRIEGRDESEFGKFAWIMDPENRRIELWEPPRKTTT